MKLALIGLGKMGILVEEVAAAKGLEIAGRFTGARPLADDDETRRLLGRDTVLVDFSAPDAVIATVRAAAGLGLDLVIGTTGWHHRLDEARRMVEKAGTGVVYGSNFSLGTHLFFRLVEHAARLFAAAADYDPFVQEAHHRFKKDSPSGTALVLQRQLEERYRGRQVPVVSLRAGHIPGTHVVGFDSAVDSIRLEHSARSRRGFAEGAILAARWIAGRRGFHTFEDVLNDASPASAS